LSLASFSKIQKPPKGTRDLDFLPHLAAEFPSIPLVRKFSFDRRPILKTPFPASLSTISITLPFARFMTVVKLDRSDTF